MKLKYFLVLITSFLLINVVNANEISTISMDIYVDNNGDAHIKETWVATLDSETEGYKPYNNLDTAEIQDYSVKLNGVEYTTISPWDVDATFEDKSYKAGIHKSDEGYELCFGISEYGLNTYELDYTIKNFIIGLNDSDVLYWTLIPHNLLNKPDKVDIKIYSDFIYDNNLEVWGYGNYGGLAYVYDGYIKVEKKNGLDSNEYMAVLAKFPKGTFNTNIKKDNNFDYYHQIAENDTTKYEYEDDSEDDDAFIMFIVLLFIIIPTILTSIVASSKSSSYGTKKLKFNKGITKVKNAPYFRDIPCNKNIFEAYWVACQFKLVKNKNDFLGTVLLKWIKNNNITNVGKDALKFNNKKNLTDLEKELYDMMEEASADGVLENKEFVEWCKTHYNKIIKWFNKVIDEQTMNYVESGLITEEKKFFSKTYLVKDEMKDNALQMSGLKNFLNDFSNIKDRESIEVMLWQEYLMYAQIFGIAKKVAKEFKNLYPDVITEEVYSDFVFINNLSYEGVHAVTTASSLSEQRARNYTAGGGGFSSGGGGAGSFGGGGSGGGGFR